MYVSGQSEVFNVYSPECAVNLFAWNIFCVSCLWKLSSASKNLHWYLLERQTCWTTLICHSSTSSLTSLTWVKGIWSNSSTGQPLKAESLFYPLTPHDVRKWGKGRRPLSALRAAPESVPLWEERQRFGRLLSALCSLGHGAASALWVFRWSLEKLGAR